MAKHSGFELQSDIDLKGKNINNTGADSSVKAKNKPEDTHRQNNTTDTTVANQVVRKGWGWVLGTGGAAASKAVTFGVTFADRPHVLVSILGYKDGSDPVHIGEGGNAAQWSISACQISTTGFSCYIRDVVTAEIGATRRVLYSWEAKESLA